MIACVRLALIWLASSRSLEQAGALQDIVGEGEPAQDCLDLLEAAYG
jgi:hypothetical protein